MRSFEKPDRTVEYANPCARPGYSLTRSDIHNSRKSNDGAWLVLGNNTGYDSASSAKICSATRLDGEMLSICMAERHGAGSAEVGGRDRLQQTSECGLRSNQQSDKLCATEEKVEAKGETMVRNG